MSFFIFGIVIYLFAGIFFISSIALWIWGNDWEDDDYACGCFVVSFLLFIFGSAFYTYGKHLLWNSYGLR